MSWLRYKGKSCYGFLCCCCLVQVISNSFVTSWTITCQAPLFMPFSRKEYWNGLPFPSPGDLPYAGVEAAPPALASRFFTTEPPGTPLGFFLKCIFSIRQIKCWMLIKGTVGAIAPKDDIPSISTMECLQKRLWSFYWGSQFRDAV